MRSQNWRQLVGKIIHETICHSLVMKESSIFNARRSTSFRILCCAVGRFSKLPDRTMHGNKDCYVQKLLKNTETLTESTVIQWTSSGIFSQDSIRCSSMKKSKVYCLEETPENLTGRIIFMSMFNDISCGTKDNATECLANSHLCTQEDLEKDNGHLLVLVLRKNGTLKVKTVHKESGTKLQKGCYWNLQEV